MPAVLTDEERAQARALGAQAAREQPPSRGTMLYVMLTVEAMSRPRERR